MSLSTSSQSSYSPSTFSGRGHVLVEGSDIPHAFRSEQPFMYRYVAWIYNIISCTTLQQRYFNQNNRTWFWKRSAGDCTGILHACNYNSMLIFFLHGPMHDVPPLTLRLGKSAVPDVSESVLFLLVPVIWSSTISSIRLFSTPSKEAILSFWLCVLTDRPSWKRNSRSPVSRTRWSIASDAIFRSSNNPRPYYPVVNSVAPEPFSSYPSLNVLQKYQDQKYSTIWFYGTGLGYEISLFLVHIMPCIYRSLAVKRSKIHVKTQEDTG